MPNLCHEITTVDVLARFAQEFTTDNRGLCYRVSMSEGQDSGVERIPWRPAWLALTVVLTVIGFGGVPDDLRTWSRWLESTDSWIDQGWVRILAIIMAALTLIVKVVDIRHGLSDRKKLVEEGGSTALNDTKTSKITALNDTENEESIALNDEEECESTTLGDNEPIVQENEPRLVDAIDRPYFTEESPENILKGNDALTEVAIEQKASPYIGKMMRVSGRVFDVENRTYFGTIVTFKTDGHSLMMASVSDECKDNAVSLTKGSRVEVIGKISYISSNHIRLEESELLPPDLSVQYISSVPFKDIDAVVSEWIENGGIEASIGANILSRLDPNRDHHS